MNSVQTALETGSYRTYEEWKRTSDNGLKIEIVSSYRTYEEWKRICIPPGLVHLDSSYRTYEEWKLCKVLNACFHTVPVLTVPMRNGNNS